MKVTVDFKKFTGEKIKPLHGVNNSPLHLDRPIDSFQEAGIPFVRMHDTGGAFGGMRFVDIPNIFPDFDADENDPASYMFEFTDAYFKQIYASGSKVFYRLGVTIENWYKIRAFRIYPPADFAKWARICEHIIRHYNEGWANGFHYNIEYWEIWCEPENPQLWLGTKEQFFDLYKTAATHLKKCFPEIKVGGYSSCGFYAVSEQDVSEFRKTFITWVESFIPWCAEEKLPLDFFSWHRYFNHLNWIDTESQYIRNLLDKNGFTQTESILDEWAYCNNENGRRWETMKDAKGASNAASIMILLQKSTVNKAMYYDAYPARAYCGLYYFPTPKVTPTYYSFKAFNTLYQLQNEVAVTAEADAPPLLAAADGNSAAVLVANTRNEAVDVVFEFKNLNGEISAVITDEQQTFERIDFSADFTMPPHSVLLLETASNSVIRQDICENTTHNFGGLDGNPLPSSNK